MSSSPPAPPDKAPTPLAGDAHTLPTSRSPWPKPTPAIDQVLLTGSTGFVGRNLYPLLCERGYRVVNATREPERARQALPDREFRRLEVTEPESIEAAMQGCQAAFFLIHGMAGGAGYDEVERRSALAFREAAERAGVSRIIYLGGIRPRGPISRHLSSRLRTGELLRAGNVPTLELQASMIIGAGSESWRIVRDLAARLPIMLLPRWLDTQSQPIDIADVIYALAMALEVPLPSSRALALPGPEVLSAKDIIMRTARLLGSRPVALRVPVVTPKLSSYWITWVTRADQRISEELVEGLRSDLVADDEGLWQLLPEYQRTSFDEAARRALLDEQRDLSLRSRMAELVIRTLSLGSIKRATPRSP
jgi:uncharacterized protein YbjT (DUF2867 family)